jgi:glycogen debranching enzyme
LSGHFDAALRQAFLIWSHQIEPGKEKLLRGRGSPDTKFTPEAVSENKQIEFAGALPTSIYEAGFSEVYGQSPDIDSSALMISTTCRILAEVLKDGQVESFQTKVLQNIQKDFKISSGEKIATGPSTMIHLIVPRMLKAIDYLASRDIDNDGLLEQHDNEDWMDTALRAGKIVYSQACWILALKDLSALLSSINKKTIADTTRDMAGKAIQAVERNLWSEVDNCYIDIQSPNHVGGLPRMLTQDVSMYLVAFTDQRAAEDLTENTNNGARPPQVGKTADQELIYKRGNRTLDVIKQRVWKDERPLVTEVGLQRTGPGTLRPNFYHNQTFWSWTTGIEILARGRFDRFEECDMLLSVLASETDLHKHTLYEWVNPITNEGCGAFPFRTGISAVRIAITEILERLRHDSDFTTAEN